MPVLVGTLDIAELCLWTFFLFFIGLVFYIRREDRREGYPLEEDLTGKILTKGGPFTIDDPKRFRLPHGAGVVFTPTGAPRDPFHIAGHRTAPFDGAPFEPTGDPFRASIGPGSWVDRAPVPDLTAEGHPRIRPMRLTPEFGIAREDSDPRGWPVVAADGVIAGRISDVWVDQSDRLIRYLECATNGGRAVLIPMAMLDVMNRRKAIRVEAITANQFERAPVIAAADQITRREEDEVVGYFGGGHLYATRDRSEPIL